MTTDTAPSALLPRRTVLAGTAWAVPAIAMTASSPAFAGTGSQTIALSTPNMQAIAKGNTTVTVTVTENNGQPATSGVVSLTGPSGVSFSPANPTISNGTATSTMTTTDTWATPGSTLTVTATTSGASKSTGLTVLGANAYGGGWNENNKIGTQSSAGTIDPPVQLTLTFPSRVRDIASNYGASNSYSLALLEDGTVWSIGQNDVGQLGDGTTTTRYTWAKIPSLSNVVQIAAGGSTGYAVLGTGEVWAWGNNAYGRLGTGNSASSSPTPERIPGITNATHIAGGITFAFARLDGGMLKSWGRNNYGQLGDGGASGAQRSVPGDVNNITSAKGISAGSYTGYALLSNGQVMSWGSNAGGALGRGDGGANSSPTAIPGVSGATQVAGSSYNGYALLSTGRVMAWGINTDGEMGNGTISETNTRHTPAEVINVSNATFVTARLASAYALLGNGDIKSWGSNNKGTLGAGPNSGVSQNGGATGTPLTVLNVANVTKLSTSGPEGAVMYYIR